jgi:outer membrane protein
MSVHRFGRMIGHWSVSRLLIILLLPMCAVIARGETLTLQHALDIAMSKSPDIQQAAYSLESSDQNLKAQQAALKSQFSLTVTPITYRKASEFDALLSQYNTTELRQAGASFRIDQRLKWTDGVLSLVNDFNWQRSSSQYFSSIERTYYDNQLYLTYDQPLFTYNRTRQTLEQLRLSLENARLNYSIQELQIEYRVTQLFYNIYQRSMSVDIAKQEYDNATESYEIIKNKVDAGISAREELYQAELTQANARSSWETSQVSYADALDNFKIALGLPLEDSIDVAADIEKKVVPVNLNRAVENAVKQRMELRQADINIRNAYFDVVQAGATNEFRGSLSLSYGIFDNAEKFSDLYQAPSRNQSVSLVFNVPLWDWGEQKSRIAASEAQLESSKLSRSEEEKQIVYEIRSSYRSLQNLLSQIDIAETNVRNAQLTYDINLERYKNGDLSSKDIAYYQNQLAQEQLNRVSALINYKLALLDLKIKSLWDFENNRSVLSQQIGAQP